MSNTPYFDAYMKGARSSKVDKWKNPCREILFDEWLTQHWTDFDFPTYPIRHTYYQYFGQSPQGVLDNE